MWLERMLGKEEILSRYLNTAYFGAGVYGVDAAAKRYFGKTAKELSLSEVGDARGPRARAFRACSHPPSRRSTAAGGVWYSMRWSRPARFPVRAGRCRAPTAHHIAGAARQSAGNELFRGYARWRREAS